MEMDGYFQISFFLYVNQIFAMTTYVSPKISARSNKFKYMSSNGVAIEMDNSNWIGSYLL